MAVLVRLLDRLASALVDRYFPDPLAGCCCHADAFNMLAARARISPRPRVEDEERYVELLGRVRDAAVEVLASGPKHTAWAGDLDASLADVIEYEQKSVFMRSTGPGNTNRQHYVIERLHFHPWESTFRAAACANDR